MGSRPGSHLDCPRTRCATLIFRACTTGYGVLARTFQSYQNTGFGSRQIAARTIVDNRVRTAQKIKERPAKMPEPMRLAGTEAPGSCNGLFSLGIPYRGLTMQERNSSDPSNQLPTSPQIDSLMGQALLFSFSAFVRRPREAPLLVYNLIRVAWAPLRCK